MTPLLLFTDDHERAESELLRRGSRILSRYTDQVFSAELADDVDPGSLKHSSTRPLSNLTEDSEFAARAWTTGKASFIEASPPRAWDAPGFDYPRNPTNDPEMAAEEEKSAALGLLAYPATNSFLIGPTAVGVIMVSGPKDKQLDLTDADRTHLLSQVQLGLNGLASVEPKAKVSFIYDTRHITVSADAGPGDVEGTSYEASEKGWRDAALEAIGHKGGGFSAQAEYVKSLIKEKKTERGYVLYLTKYPLRHFAYASSASGRLAMELGHDGRGRNNIQYTIAHETAHVFGAGDEYGKCSCFSTWGVDDVLNKNCRNCTNLPQGRQLDCLMNSDNQYVLCSWSRSQLGWKESRFPKQ